MLFLLHAATHANALPFHPQPLAIAYPDLRYFPAMDEALEGAKNHVLEYYEQYQVVENQEGNITLSALPLVSVPRGKKSIKEFFQVCESGLYFARANGIGASLEHLPVSMPEVDID